ncbi:MAG: glycosyltransferase [Alphaproteobacteria bacterium]|nr:glycosyltransferase [Alphaproteobacteria bacterium]
MGGTRPKVLHVIPGLGLGGAEAMLTNIATAPGRRTEPIVVDLLRGGANADRLRAANIPLHELGVRGPTSFLFALRRLARLIDDLQPDVVQGWMYYGDLAAALALGRSGRRDTTRLYWGVRCSDMDLSNYGLALRSAVRACRRFSHMPDAVIANSEAGARVHRALGYRSSAFLVIENGVDTDRFRPDATLRAATRDALGVDAAAQVAILPARVDPMKDHAGFLAALDSLPGVTGLAVGLGTERLPRRANLIGLGPRDDMPALYNAADLMVLSSAYGEGFSTVLGEAMACGLPAVVTDVGDSARIVADTGSVVPPRDPAALAAAIAAFFSKPAAERAALGQAARARMVEEFSLERALERFETLYLKGPLDSSIETAA